MKLGTKVKCNGYLKKVDTKHVDLESNRKNVIGDDKLTKEMCELLNITEDWSDNTIFIEDEVYQYIKIIKMRNFEGIIVANKRVTTTRWYETVDESYGYSREDKPGIKVTHCDYVDCYQVFFRMGGSRLVPIELCEVKNES